MKKFLITFLLCFCLGCSSDKDVGDVHVFVFGFGYVKVKPKEGYSVSAETKGAALMITNQTQDIMIGDQYNSVTAVPMTSFQNDSSNEK